ncbi:FUSC family protein [Actinoplanes sp. NPDC051851]|uniref:FUSC family protein n=1 Tax=Actinoplanes sp. NPDC051851 TaxID=3154753 RepID=UPI003421E76B
MTTALLPRPRQFWHVNRHAGDHHPALRMAVSSMVPMVALVLAGHASWSAWAVLGTMAAIYGRLDTPWRRLRVQVAVGLTLVTLVVAGTALAAADASGWTLVLCTALVAGAATVLTDLGRWAPTGPLFPVLVFGASSAQTVTTSDVRIAGLVALGALAWALTVTAVAGAVDLPGAPPQQLPPPRAGARLITLHTAVCLVAVALAGSVSVLAGWQHPAWAMVAAVVPVVGRTTSGQLLRAGQRLLGTLAGVLVAGVLYAIPFTPLTAALVLGTLLFGAELLIARNYALALLCITPATIGLAHPSGSDQLWSLLADRTLENATGIAVVVLLILATHRLRHPRP